MIRRTKHVNIYRDRYGEKQRALYRVTTFWFLFIPIYSYDEIIE